MVAGVNGRLSPNVLRHAVEVHRHVNGNVTIQVRLLEDNIVLEIQRRLRSAILSFVQVNASTVFQMLVFCLFVLGFYGPVNNE